MQSKSTTEQQSLTDLLVACLTGEADEPIMVAYELLYPASFDPETGTCRITEDN